MATLTAERTMLYCPKCQRKYEEGIQRFCNNDGGRLLPAVNAGVKRQNESKGVFTNLLAKASPRDERDEKLSAKPRFVKAENVEPQFKSDKKNKVFKTEHQINPKIGKPTSRPVLSAKPLGQKKSAEIRLPNVKAQPIKTPKPIENKITSDRLTKEPANNSKPLSRLITTNDVNLGRAALGDRKINPTGRLALTWQNPRVLLGQIIKGRYYIAEKVDQDLTSIAYLAEDQIREGKKVILRVLMEQSSSDNFQNKLMAEERVSLSHINHPNIAKVFDSGELPEGKPFIVSDFVENESVGDYLKKTGIFNALRTARIIRQSSYALSEIHQNGILHRNLQPKHLLLTVSEAGNEVVQVTDFCVSDGKITTDNFRYKSPEQISGQLPTFASDSYSLAVIAYQMLTNRLPFKGESESELVKSQRTRLNIEASNLNTDINPLVDGVLSKALSLNPSDRFPKARDFGEALFNALTTALPSESEFKIEEPIDFQIDLPEKNEQNPLPNTPIGVPNEAKTESDEHISIEPTVMTPDIHFDSNISDLEVNETSEVGGEVLDEFVVPAQDVGEKDTLWKKRSPEPTREGGGLFTLLSIIGLVALVFGAFAIWNYFNNLDDSQLNVASDTEQLESDAKPAQGVDSNLNKNLLPEEEIPSPPLPRDIETPKGFAYFENAKQNLSADLAKQFRGFSIAYPKKDWKLKKFDKKKDKVDDKFLDIAKETNGGIPIEAFIISPYDSKGTFTDDISLFPKLVEKSNADISKSLSGNYEVVSEGKTTIQNGRWKAYQVNFRTKEKDKVNGKEIELWGRRLWIPVQRPGVEHGFIITMFATSLSDQVKSADDVGKTGDLAKILETFEPTQNY